MLTARTKTGKIICLGNEYKKETLLAFRNQEEFICPVCGEAVILKLGEQRIFHFAHKRGGSCLEFSEGETENHLKGKLQLYRWLVSQNIPAILEYYDREIAQRPDIMFKFQGQRYALEFQCSPIPERIFIKRTRTYRDNGYEPLWILSHQHLHFKKRNVLSLSNFHYLFLRTAKTGKFYLPSYCPDERLFHLADSIIPYSVKQAFVQHSIYPIEKLTLSSLLNPPTAFKKLWLPGWERELEKFKMQWSLHPRANTNHFLREIYSQNMNLFLLPAEIGLPVPHSLFIQTSAIVWQTYILLDVLKEKKPGDLLKLNEIRGKLNRRIARKNIMIRHLPQLDSVDYMVPVKEYLYVLERFGILLQQDIDSFQLLHTIIIPRSNREKEELRSAFYQKVMTFSQNNK
ncbi:competence protein CoiA family protein [Neobacillus sp. OS1-32]|uniref:Competence protein CoiA n=1 Tax=Neobacillus paridis TaxID=2803862 RepID=A0ABS1TM83_9BACI|nr:MULTISPECIES: competence protein CoiA family protein [Neobacillus]MBL4952405.1 hypothetical protein [Neobacillus paridis]WML32063.1 competence protein CoiA family protein [Neobacillus sp. OS1-32]